MAIFHRLTLVILFFFHFIFRYFIFFFSGMSTENLQVQIKEMRKYITSGLRRKVEEQVLNDLASHETITYIKALEDEKEHYKKTVRCFCCFCLLFFPIFSYSCFFFFEKIIIPF